MTDATPRAGLPLLAAAQAQKHVTHNDALLQLDALIFARFLSRNLSAPPSTPANGDTYLVKATASGAWTGKNGQIAYAVDGVWRFTAPFVGLTAYVVDESKLVIFNATAWVDYASLSALQNVPLLGVNATADATNKLSVSSAALLFNHAGNGVQMKLNKNAAADTASLLYQTGFSGRAELGLTGDDHFHFKVSPDGSSWNEALKLDKVTGSARFLSVGIGMTPVNALDITQNQNAASTISITNGNGGASEQARFLINGNLVVAQFGSGFASSGINRASGALIRGDGAGGVTLATGAAQPIYFGINSAEVARFGIASAVAGLYIGNTAPVAGAPKLYVNYNAAGGANGIILKDDYGAAGTFDAIGFYRGASTKVGQIATTISDVLYQTASDARLKTWLEDQRDFRGIIAGIEVGDAEWKASPGSRSLVIFAQQAYRHFPDAINRPGNDGDLWMADYGRLAPLALWGVKDLYGEVQELRARLVKTEAALAELRAAKPPGSAP